MVRRILVLLIALCLHPGAWGGEPAGGLETVALPGLDGAPHALVEWRGKVVVLNFWATWCAPCQAEIGQLMALQERHGRAGLQVVGLGLDREKKLRNVQRTLGISYPILVADPERYADLLPRWGNSQGVVPYTVVIDRAGRVRYTHRGLLDRETLEESVLPLLAESEYKS